MKIKTEILLELIKTKLTEDNGEDSWEDFVDNQQIGDCQTITFFIKHDFPQIKKVFGEIEIDQPYYDEDGEEQNLMTHHWIEINKKIYDFSKGTLSDHINWENKYDPDSSEDEWRYNKIW